MANISPLWHFQSSSHLIRKVFRIVTEYKYCMLVRILVKYWAKKPVINMYFVFCFCFFPFFHFPRSRDVEKRGLTMYCCALAGREFRQNCAKSRFCFLKPNLIGRKCSKFDKKKIFTTKHNSLFIIPCFNQYLPPNGDPCPQRHGVIKQSCIFQLKWIDLIIFGGSINQKNIFH